MNRLFVLVGALLAVVAGLAATNVLGFAAVVAALGLLALLVLPRHWLPAIALAVFALLPVGYLSEVPFAIGRYVTPSLVILAVWVLRSSGRRGSVPRPTLWVALSVTTAAWLAISTLSSIDLVKSAMWSVTFCVLVLLVGHVAFRVDELTVSTLLRTWLWLGVGLGALGTVEGLSEWSLFSRFYVTADGGFTDRWSVHRITTLLGHPLMNGTFFAVTACLALFLAVQTRSKLAAVSAVLSAFGVAFSVSRSATLALVVGVAVGVVLMLCTRDQTVGRKVFASALVVIGAFALLNSPLLIERSQSVEGTSSSTIRDTAVETATSMAAQDDYLGSGIGTSNIRSVDAGQQFTIENSFLGVLVSAGIPGLLLVTGVLIAGFLVALRRGRLPVAAAIIAYVVVSAGWPLWENVPAAFVLASGLLILAFAPRPNTESGHDADANTLGELATQRA